MNNLMVNKSGCFMVGLQAAWLRLNVWLHLVVVDAWEKKLNMKMNLWIKKSIISSGFSGKEGGLRVAHNQRTFAQM